jgi:alkaline phosphatase D
VDEPSLGAAFPAPPSDRRSHADRRRFLQLAAACATTLWLPRCAWSQPRFASDPFALGVASGSPTHDSVVLWTRLAPEALFRSNLSTGPVTVRWEIAHDDKFRRIVRKGQSPADAALADSVHVEVDGLEPDRWYFYRFMVGHAQSVVGRTRTFPSPDAAAHRLRIAYASCQRWEHGYFSAYRHMRAENPDIVLFLGDYIYEYPNAKNAVRVPTGGWVRTLADYRQRYALHKSDADLRAMHAVCPWLVTWDDHEVQNDYAGRKEGDSGTPVADFAALRAAAYQAYYEHMPLRAAVLTRALAGLRTGADMRIHSSVRFGALASFHLVDDRQYRDPQACTRDGKAGSSTVNPATCAEWQDPKRSLLGADQELWLDDAFAHGSEGWNVLGLQTLFGQRELGAGRSPIFWNDGWDGYPAARARMIASMRKHTLANPVLLGGDVHQNWVGHVKADYADPQSPPIGVEFCGTSISARSDDGGRIDDIVARNPHFVFANATRRGYGIVEFTPKRLTASLRVVDDVTRRDTRIETLAKFSVEAGRSVIVAA